MLGVSCGAPAACVAVGTAVDLDPVTLADGVIQTWNGVNWRQQPLAVSGGGFAGASLDGVSCTSATNCIAVGGTNLQPVAVRWDGSTSHVAPGPWTGASLPAFEGSLEGVSCTGAASCVAVGYQGTDTLVATWDGNTWSVVPSPSPGAYRSELTAVSCSTATACVAVGYQEATQGGPNQALIESWSGGAWSVVGSSPGGSASQLNGVACSSPDSCQAVGWAVQTDTYGALVAGWSGGAWTFSHPDGSAPGSAGSTIVDLTSVSCVSASSCVAAGASGDGSTANGTGGALESWDGTSWTPVPGATTALTGVSCPAAGACLALGASPVAQTGAFLHGYWLTGSDGGIFTFGSATFYGSTGALTLERPVVGITPTDDQAGYWLVATDGGIFSFGDATYNGSLPGLGFAPAGSAGPGPKLNAPIIGMVPAVAELGSTQQSGYFMVGADGGVFAFGTAFYEGSCPAIGGCDARAVAVMPDATGDGYWLVTAVGTVYAFGDAPVLGSVPPQSVPVTSAVRTPDGKGYWLLFANGVVAAFGDAPALGGIVGQTSALNPATAIFATATGQGYWIATANGSVHPFGDATSAGDMAGQPLNGPIIAASGF